MTEALDLGYIVELKKTREGLFVSLSYFYEGKVFRCGKVLTYKEAEHCPLPFLNPYWRSAFRNWFRNCF